MPIWMRLDAHGIRIIDVRDERAAVHMAQAHAEVTGELGVALVTAGPGVTNAMTGIANAHVSRAPVLVIAGTNPRPQENRGGLQDLDHTHLVRTITRYARTVREPALALAELDEAISRAFGEGGEPGPAYIDFPVDTLRSPVPKPVQLEEHLRPKERPLTRPARRRSRKLSISCGRRAASWSYQVGAPVAQVPNSSHSLIGSVLSTSTQARAVVLYRTRTRPWLAPCAAR